MTASILQLFAVWEAVLLGIVMIVSLIIAWTDGCKPLVRRGKENEVAGAGELAAQGMDQLAHLAPREAPVRVIITPYRPGPVQTEEAHAQTREAGHEGVQRQEIGAQRDSEMNEAKTAKGKVKRAAATKSKQGSKSKGEEGKGIRRRPTSRKGHPVNGTQRIKKKLWHRLPFMRMLN